MPRMYYNQADVDVHRNLLLAHGALYLLVITWVWNMPLLTYATLLTPLWTLLFAAHAFAQTPLSEGLQQRTYNRLRNKLGVDWDLAATTEEFELEAKRAQLDAALSLTINGTMTTGSLIIAQWVLLIVTLQMVFPVDYFMLAFAGWGAFIVGAQSILRWRLRDNRTNLDRVQRKKAASVAQNISQAKVSPTPRIGMTYAIGDDGELVEVPEKQQEQIH